MTSQNSTLQNHHVFWWCVTSPQYWRPAWNSRKPSLRPSSSRWGRILAETICKPQLWKSHSRKIFWRFQIIRWCWGEENDRKHPLFLKGIRMCEDRKPILFLDGPTKVHFRVRDYSGCVFTVKLYIYVCVCIYYPIICYYIIYCYSI